MSAFPHRLSFSQKAVYGFGQLAEGLKNGAFGAFLFFFYVQVLGLPGTLAGTAIGLALLVDAVSDPLCGSISDHWHSSRLGRRHPFMYAAVVPMCLGFGLLFSPPDTGNIGLFLWMLAFTVLTRFSMTLYHVPHVALGAEFSDDFDERTVIVAFRQFFSTLGVLVAYGVGFGLFFRTSSAGINGQFEPGAYGAFAVCLAVLMAVAILGSAHGTRRHIPYLNQPGTGQASLSVVRTLVRTFLEMRGAFQNRSFAWLMGGALVLNMIVGVDAALSLHVNLFFWELTSDQNFVFFLAYPVGLITGAALAPVFGSSLGKKSIIITGATWWAFCQLAPVTARLLGWMPENGTAALAAILVSVKFLQGLGVVQAVIIFGSMVADLVDEHELTHGRRQEGIFYASSSFATKFTSGIGGVVGGITLDVIEWPRGIAVRTAADVSSETLFSLGLAYGPMLSIFAIAGVWCYSKYRLDRSRHAQIMTALKTARARAHGDAAGIAADARALE